MVTAEKKKYMRRYNRKPEVRARKAEYMRKMRMEKDRIAAVELVNFLLDIGYESMAFEYAKERSPELLIALKNKVRHVKQKQHA